MGADTENEMERIHRGLEDFLKQELKATEPKQRQKEPKLYTIEEPKQEKEINVIGSTGKKSRAKVETYRLEDWDRTGNRPGSPGQPGRSRTSNTGRSPGSHTRSRSVQPETERVDISRRRPGKKQSGKSPGSKKPKENRAVTPRQAKGGKSRRPFVSRLKRFLLVTVLVLALLGLGLYQLVGMVYHKMNYAQIASQTKLPLQQEGAVNILLIGNDSRQNGEDGRSDAMILLSVSSRTRKIYMISLLRDIYVEIPGHDNNRLNAAYSFGGAELLMETIEKNFDIPVHRYVQVNFEAFANLLDAVGGVDLELSREEIEYVNGYLVEYNMLTNRPQGTDNMDPEASGMVHLNGPQALAYCRIRYLGTDFGRTERQRKVMAEVIKKLPGAVLTNFGELTDGLLPNLTTNLTQWECFRLSLMGGKLLTYDLVPDSIPQPGTYKSATIRKMSVLEVDFDANRKYLKGKIYGE